MWFVRILVLWDNIEAVNRLRNVRRRPVGEKRCLSGDGITWRRLVSADRTIRGRLSRLRPSAGLESTWRPILAVININYIDLGGARRFLVGRAPRPQCARRQLNSILARSNAGRSAGRTPTGRLNAEFSTRRPGIRRRWPMSDGSDTVNTGPTSDEAAQQLPPCAGGGLSVGGHVWPRSDDRELADTRRASHACPISPPGAV